MNFFLIVALALVGGLVHSVRAQAPGGDTPYQYTSVPAYTVGKTAPVSSTDFNGLISAPSSAYFGANNNAVLVASLAAATCPTCSTAAVGSQRLFQGPLDFNTTLTGCVWINGQNSAAVNSYATVANNVNFCQCDALLYINGPSVPLNSGDGNDAANKGVNSSSPVFVQSGLCSLTPDGSGPIAAAGYTCFAVDWDSNNVCGTWVPAEMTAENPIFVREANGTTNGTTSQATSIRDGMMLRIMAPVVSMILGAAYFKN